MSTQGLKDAFDYPNSSVGGDLHGGFHPDLDADCDCVINVLGTVDNRSVSQAVHAGLGEARSTDGTEDLVHNSEGVRAVYSNHANRAGTGRGKDVTAVVSVRTHTPASARYFV